MLHQTYIPITYVCTEHTAKNKSWHSENISQLNSDNVRAAAGSIGQLNQILHSRFQSICKARLKILTCNHTKVRFTNVRTYFTYVMYIYEHSFLKYLMPCQMSGHYTINAY